MTGGILFIFDESERIHQKINSDYVGIAALDNPDRALLRKLIESHVRYTESPCGALIASAFDTVVAYFRKIVPL